MNKQKGHPSGLTLEERKALAHKHGYETYFDYRRRSSEKFTKKALKTLFGGIIIIGLGLGLRDRIIGILENSQSKGMEIHDLGNQLQSATIEAEIGK